MPDLMPHLGMLVLFPVLLPLILTAKRTLDRFVWHLE